MNDMGKIVLFLAFGLVFLQGCTCAVHSSSDTDEVEPSEIKALLAEIKSEIRLLPQELRRMMAFAESYCPPGFVYLPKADSCYKIFSEIRSTWSSAFQQCQDLYDGAHLAVISSDTENNAIKWFLKSEIAKNPNMSCYNSGWPAGGNMFWVGGQRDNITSCSSEFVWKLPGDIRSPMNFTDWLPREPNCNGGAEHCLHIWPNRQYRWNDGNCGNRVCAICEYNSFF